MPVMSVSAGDLFMGYEEEFVKYVRAVADGVHRIGAADRAAAR